MGSGSAPYPERVSAERTQHNARLFGQVAPTYDRLGFLTLAARHLAARTPIRAGDHVLDVACGTGTVALALAERVGPQVTVTGTDLAPEMVEVARRKGVGAVNLRFEVADGAALPFPDATFDVVTCAAGLFFLPDMTAALREWRRVLRPGGRVVFSTFGRGLLGDLPGLWRERLAGDGVKPGAPPLGRVPTPAAALDLLRGAGFTQAEAELTRLEYVLPDAGARWADIQAGLEGAPLATFPEARRAELRAAHLAELSPLFAGGPVTVPIPVIVACGIRAAG